MAAIRDAHPSSSGSLVFLSLDLGDLAAVKASAARFLDIETKLDVLFNNAGVMVPAPGSRTTQGYELQLGVNNLGPFLFTKLLTPILAATAKKAEQGSVRVVWVSSMATEMVPIVPTGGMDMADIENRASKANFLCYALSKSGNYLHGVEYAKRYTASEGIVSVPLNPGNLNSDLWRTQGWLVAKMLKAFVLHPPVRGAYTELFAGLSPDVTLEKSGEWGEFFFPSPIFSFVASLIISCAFLYFPAAKHVLTHCVVGPWGRFVPIRPDLKLAVKTKEEGGHGTSEAFWEWSEKQVKDYL